MIEVLKFFFDDFWHFAGLVVVLGMLISMIEAARNK
jgi:hypothetical protein